MLEPNATGQQQTPQQTPQVPPSTNGTGEEVVSPDALLAEMLQQSGPAPVNEKMDETTKGVVETQFRQEIELRMIRLEKGLKELSPNAPASDVQKYIRAAFQQDSLAQWKIAMDAFRKTAEAEQNSKSSDDIRRVEPANSGTKGKPAEGGNIFETMRNISASYEK